MEKDSGYMSSDVIGCQFSVYPLRQTDISESIRGAIDAAHEAGCQVRVQNLSTLMYGTEDQVFAALRAAFGAAQRPGSSVLIATLVAGMPTDELIGEIQEGIEAHG